MNGFTDIHAHFVYGIDDGPQTRKEMESMLDAANMDGITSWFATPHVIPGMRPFPLALFQERLEDGRQYCRQKRYPLKLYDGAEVLFTPLLERYASEHCLPTLAQSGHLLLEFVPDISFGELRKTLEKLEHYGYVTVLAHAERYECLFRPGALRCLKETCNIRCQINCNSLLTKRGPMRDLGIHRWFKEELVDFVATDAHNCSSRPSRMHAAYDVLTRRYGRVYAQKLTGCD